MPKSVHTPAYRLFLRLLSERREERGWSQRELGRRMEAHHTYVNMCESGERQLNIIELRQWCGILDLSFPDFVQQLDEALTQTESAQGNNATPPTEGNADNSA